MDKDMENELYDFIVGSNAEWILIEQCKDEKTRQKLKRWLQID